MITIVNTPGVIDALLGYKAKDKVTGFTGVVTSITFDLYGCVQALLHPGLDAEGKIKDQAWFDIGRLDVVQGVDRVMPVPTFSIAALSGEQQSSPILIREKGPVDKPPFPKS